MGRPKREDYFEKLYMGLPPKKNGGRPPPAPVVSTEGINAIKNGRTVPAKKEVMTWPEPPEPKEEVVHDTTSLPDLDLKVRQIQEYVARQCGVTLKDLIGHYNHKALANPRHIAMWITKQLLAVSAQEIARRFDRDPGSIPHALTKIDSMDRQSPSMHLQLERFCQEIRQLHPWIQS